MTVCLWLAASQWFSLGTPVSTTNKTDSEILTEIFSTVVLYTHDLSSCVYELSSIIEWLERKYFIMKLVLLNIYLVYEDYRCVLGYWYDVYNN